jgi:gamma-glutamylcyclotransferase (GGCT)/AIG2-like uncharacterized protein YtfP
MKVFVYGSLLSGLALHAALNGAKPLGLATTRGALYDLGPFPALSAGKRTVVGELYEVGQEMLDELDQIEGFQANNPQDSLYLRQTITVTNHEDGQAHQAQAYFYNRTLDSATPIPHGDYRRYLEELDEGQDP